MSHFIKRYGEKLVVLVLLLAVVAVSPVGTQGAVVIFGTVSGAPKAIAADASGNLQVAVTGGSGSFTSWTTSAADTANVAGIALTSSDGINILNSTAATGGVTVQMSPRLKFCGTAWNSSGGASETDCWKIENLPATVAGTTTSQLVFSASINGGAYADAFTVRSDGLTTIKNNLSLVFGTFGRLTPQSDGVLSLMNNASNGFTRLQFGGTTTAFPALTRSGNALSLTSGDGTLGAVLGHGAQTVTLDGVTTFAITADHIILTCTGAETINTITGGVTGARIIIEDDDTDCTLADDDSATAANAIDLTGATTNIVGAVHRTLELVFVSGGWWEEIATSDN